MRTALAKAISEVLCSLGLHSWEKEPSISVGLQKLDRRIGVLNYFVQKGIRECVHCHKMQLVRRTGYESPLGGHESTRWHKGSAEEAWNIDKLPML